MTSEQAPSAPHLLLRATALFHKIEIAYVVAATALVLYTVLRLDQELLIFNLVWAAVCVAAAITALRHDTRRGVVVCAELLLLAAALGLWVGSHHEVFPALGHSIRDADKWNLLPLTHRRIVAWNICAALTVGWLSLPYFILVYDPYAFRGTVAREAQVALFIPIWIAFGYALWGVARVTIS